MGEMVDFLVYGALRSGTTVFRLMLNAHPDLHNPGEADFLFDHVHRTGGQAEAPWRYDTRALRLDRVFRRSGLHTPWEREGTSRNGAANLQALLAQFRRCPDELLSLNVHRHIDKIVELLPEVKIIHLLRDPRDVARSCIGMGWAGRPHYGVQGWIDTERAWDRIASKLAPEMVLEVRYEQLIADTEGSLRAVCAFLGVPFDAAMLGYHKNTNYAAPDTRLIDQWRTALSERDLGLIEAGLGPLLAARGYAPSGVPAIEPGLARRACEHLQNKSAVWQSAVRRYGLRLVLGEKVSRRFGLRTAHERYRLEIDQLMEAELR